ncbi:MAG: GTP cyclohydrolase I FolE [Opitutales bacterium]|nr:GTP cyclohydrolase I FolE [Opitutales bacterium]
MEKSITECLQALFRQCGEDPQRTGLVQTPHRFLQSFQECTQGYGQTAEEVVGGALFPCDNPAPVVIQRIPFFSLCEHHLLPFFGYGTVAYLPSQKVLGVSKVYRLVNLFARRLQLQERLTQQIGEAIQRVAQARGVWVEMRGEHLCVAMRGVQRTDSQMRTFFQSGERIDSSLLGTENSSSENQNHLRVITAELPMKIGCSQEEQRTMTPVQMVLELKIPSSYGTCSDDLAQTVDYDALVQWVYQTIFHKRFQLLEYATQQVHQTIRQFLQDHHRKAAIRVTLIKKLTHPLVQESQFTIGDFA